MDDEFRLKMRKVCEAASVLREHTQDLGPTERMSFIKCVLFDRPGNWKHIWCRPEVYGKGLQEAMK